MKAVVLEEFGGPEVLRVAEVDAPEPGPGQVRVRARAIGVNPLDGKIRSGAMRDVFPVSLPAVLGAEVAGEVDAVGPDVTGVSVGDAVFGFSDGGAYAEQALTSSFAHKPAELSWERAVALPVAVETSDRVLRLLGVKSGETLLVHGAAGAVGALAVQIALASGIRVIGTAGAGNQERLAALGAVPTTYGDGLVDRVRALAPDGVDAVFDVAGRGALADSVELRGGATDRIVTIADPGAAEHGVVFSGASERDPARLAEVAELVARDSFTVDIGATFPLADAPEAHRTTESGHSQGKIVLLP
ncbi:NADP-dependent oxidoreductase [Saccharothrix yanglingensis]|uniref:NADPH:quinone reductase n=1 Tax=Saccharothrix yanglingensis TaxID=659496 RepID=A0ABU0X066_9PSEU|nr:NADP-dependent oxidoreductase [Saccharothrix yanglingensis]MDQ2585521.1 NADPH:quinone reductase [Saccharothrix yanglingensis]